MRKTSLIVPVVVLFVVLAAAALADAVYHGNIRSRVFHQSGCRYYNCSNCTVEFTSREAAIRAGYRPCRICKP